MYIVPQSHLFYRILYPPLSTLLPLMFVISCVCQLFNKECTYDDMMMMTVRVFSRAVFLVRAHLEFAHHGVKHDDFCCFKGVTMSPLHRIIKREVCLR